MIHVDRKKCLLTDTEIKVLIDESNRTNYLDVAFGGRLLDEPSNDWAFERVEELRNFQVKTPCPIPDDPEQRLDIVCAHCGTPIDFRKGEVFINHRKSSYVCRQHTENRK